jgi:hypothetical protein
MRKKKEDRGGGNGADDMRQMKVYKEERVRRLRNEGA